MNRASATIILDTNVLYTENDIKIVSHELEAQLEECHALADLQVIVPQIVIDEILYQKAAFATQLIAETSRQLKTLSKLAELPQVRIATKEKVTRALRRKLRRWCKERKIAIEPIPIKKIGWSALIEAAIWHKPPFSPPSDRKEKGFKDALLLETVCAIALRVSQDILFVTGDGLLREAALARIGGADHGFSVFESFTDLHSHLKLLHEQRSKEFSEKLLKKAGPFFFTPDRPDCLYFQFDIWGKITGKFASDLEAFPSLTLASPVGAIKDAYLPSWKSTLTIGQPWVPASQDTIFVIPPQFEKLDDRRYFWVSKIKVARLYSQSATQTSLEQSAIRIAYFDVNWSCDVSDYADLSNAQIEQITLSSNKAEWETLFNAAKNGLPSRMERLANRFTATGKTHDPLA